MTFSIRNKLFLSHFVAILLVSGSIGTYFYQNAITDLVESLQSRLKYSAALISHNFDAETLDLIHDESALGSDAHNQAVQVAQDLAASNPDIAFVYVMRLTDNAVRFVVDSDTDEPAAPGEAYEEHIPELVKGFTELSVDSEITSDRWGNFMSGYSPIEGGNAPLMVGIDMRADEVKTKLSALRNKGVISLISAIVFAYFSALILSSSMIRRITRLHDRCMQTAPVQKEIGNITSGDELDKLGKAFDFMLESVQEKHENLEQQIDIRTKELQEINNKLSEEIEERKRMEKVIHKSATTDHLTGLANRRGITAVLDKAVNNRGDYSIVLIDIDHFKGINDKYGHDVGDKVLRRFARFLLHNVSPSSIAGRWGGEEFIVVIPNASAEQAYDEAEKLRIRISEDQLTLDDIPGPLTASFGIAENEERETWNRVIKRADVALYKAKKSGRNKSVLSHPDHALS